MKYSNNRFISSYSNLINLRIVSMCATWYFISSLTSQLTKSILTDFHFPIFVGEFQFLSNLLLGYITIYILLKFPHLRFQLPKNSVPPGKFIIDKKLLKIFLPMGSFQFIGKLFSLAATSLCPIATVASVRALSPLLIVFGYRTYYKVRFPITTYLSLIPLLLGVIIIVFSQSIEKEAQFIKLHLNDMNTTPNFNSTAAAQAAAELYSDQSGNLKGIAYAFTAALIFAFQSIYAKNVVNVGTLNKLHKDPGSLALSKQLPINDNDNLEKGFYNSSSTSSTGFSSPINNGNGNNTSYEKLNSNLIVDKPDKLTTLMYCAMFGLAFSTPTFTTYELYDLLFENSIITGIRNIYSIPWFLLILNGISHFSQSLLAFHLLGMLPTVTYSIAAMMKRIVIITISMILTGKKLTLLEGLGLFFIGVGLFSYDRWGSRK
ncbi:hypothetical protein CANARDRAFT_6259 [[Candida] arabinofermentans NRRL YB-2248]|uniref:Sugar phosphate transporter domain-containing protein n=1 Tax=[Candida] arabinofermentans NRRL YB-2248 TaxID=983967 RepID=A0A1E4T4I7_9ASCO|nr:hypothetical protein CANARDRAFT_6259 [[Candida] arabinofermentans NRRL YB-2248]